MTILYNQIIREFDPDPALDADDRAQPLTVEPCDAFVLLTQWDGSAEIQHFILVERRDVQALIEALQRS